MDASHTNHIVILGGGFGGLTCARMLDRIFRSHRTSPDHFSITLVDRRNYHLYTPLLYEVATTASDDASVLHLKKAVAIPFDGIITGTRIRFQQKTVLDIDTKKKEVCCDDGTALSYDYLVIALGSEASFFNIPGVKEHAIPLKWLEDAIHIRSTVRSAYALKHDEDALSVVIGGGGPAGIELAAELTGYIKKLNRKEKKNIRPLITVVEGAPTILPGFDPITVRQATARLASLRVFLRAGCVVARADASTVFITETPPPTVPKNNAEKEALPYDLFVWGGGTQGCAVGGSGLSKEKRGRIETAASLCCLSADAHGGIAPHVFAIGDIACFYDPVSHRPAAGTARVAIEEAKIVAHNIYRTIAGKSLLSYVPKQYTFVVPLGGKYAIAKTGPFRFTGFSGWIIKELIEAYYLLSATRKLRAVAQWWHTVRIFSKND